MVQMCFRPAVVFLQIFIYSANYKVLFPFFLGTGPQFLVTGGFMDARPRLQALENRQKFCSCQEWNHDSSDIQPVA